MEIFFGLIFKFKNLLITLTKFKIIIGAPNRVNNCLKCLAETIAKGSEISTSRIWRKDFLKFNLKKKNCKITINRWFGNLFGILWPKQRNRTSTKHERCKIALPEWRYCCIVHNLFCFNFICYVALFNLEKDYFLGLLEWKKLLRIFTSLVPPRFKNLVPFTKISFFKYTIIKWRRANYLHI